MGVAGVPYVDRAHAGRSLAELLAHLRGDDVVVLGLPRGGVAVPVGPPGTPEAFGDAADEVVCAQMPAHLSAVGQWYENFSQTSDAEVTDLLERARAPRSSS